MRHRLLIAGLAALTLAGTAASPTLAQTRTAKVSAYCSACSSTRCSTGKRLTIGTVAADPRYHPIGTKIKFGAPINAVLTVADTGGAIKGRDRFDRSYGVCRKCSGDLRWGVRRVAYTVVGR